ncbi:MAG: CoA activase [candidate division WOR-3 bacterium]|nr:MAG: CoA activase [candidate division WOR-3 bacterium]
MREIGIDIGSVSLKYAEFKNGKLVRTLYVKHQGKPYDVLLAILRDTGSIDRLVVTGSSARELTDLLGAVYINEVEATAHGVIHFHPDVRSIIEIGGEDSKLINMNDGHIDDFASNTICAAGTGIFLDQQARRLCYKVEEFGKISACSKNPARIAGRCSVFAKSDMIHLQQIGTKPEDLMSGLCYALARNFKSVIAKGKDISTPVAFVGGVAANVGMVKAFQHSLHIPEHAFIIPEHHNCIGAIGAVLASRIGDGKAVYRGYQAFEQWLSQPKTIKRLEPLNGHERWHPITMANPSTEKKRAYLGIDVGSISTNLVLIDDNGTVLARQYLWTKGRPIEVVLEGLAALKKEIGDNVEIKGAGTTGSGRYLIGEFVGADIIKNEITAQAHAAIQIDPEVDTIFEIGGQDSKYISVRNGTIVDFEMNKVCAAGTGSFLEEQAEVLGVKLEEFGDLALNAQSPINLGERCTVFIGSEVVHHQKDTRERENLLAGLGYSIAYNYLNRVVNGKPVGDRIFFQGGVAANKAVVSAFEQVLQKSVTVPVNYDITGAIGIALLVREENIERTRFKGFDLISQHYTSSSFVCSECSNECEINKILIEGERPIHYGGRCGRYEEKEKKKDNGLPDYFTLRNEIFFKTDDVDGIEIGIPRSLAMYELFPFFYRFLTELGFRPILSDSTNRGIIEMGAEASVADTCLPVKIALGHIQNLIKKNVRNIFIPSIITMAPKDDTFTRCFVCPYVQTIPYMARTVFGKDIKISAPYIYFDRGKEGIEDSLTAFARGFGKTTAQAKKALKAAAAYQRTVEENIQAIGQEVFQKLEGPAFVLCSRPYNGYDLGLNLNLPKKLRDLGVTALPLDFIPLQYENLHDDFYNMYWHYGQRILAAAETIREHNNLFAVYVSNFACGPDSFLTRFFKEKLGEKPYLLIEIDEHSGDAGFITRCEAFHDSISGTRNKSIPRKIKAASEVHRSRTIYIPDMCDAAQMLAAAMRYSGVDARVLPPPDEESITIGRQFTSGKECFPAILTAGDMIKKIRSPDFVPETSAFLMAQGSGPCRFGQYYKLHRLILDDLGYHDMPIYAPNQGPSLFDDLGEIGWKFLFLTWDGICAVDALEAQSRMIRPYEVEKGTTERLYNTALQNIISMIEQGMNVMPYLKQVKREFDIITIDRSLSKPRIGIVGEIYVRSQRFSNTFIEKKLEDLGCEVALPAIGEWFFYTNFTRERNCRWFRQYRRALFTKFFNKYMTWRHKRIYDVFELVHESHITALLDYAHDILHPSFEGEAILSVGKTIDFIEKNFSGVVNVMPFTCMPGNIVTTLYKSIKDIYPDFPLFVLSLDGLDHAVDAMRLETFVSQARNYHTCKVPATAAQVV